MDARAPDGDASALGDNGYYEFCPPTPRGCDLPPGRYVPVVAGEATVVWQPSGGRYTNEPTLIRDEATGLWHVFANSSALPDDPWGEVRLVHASAPSLYGPWTEHPDALAASDPGSNERTLWAPFAMRDGAGYRLIYHVQTPSGREETHTAVSTDLFHWTREPERYLPGGRDAMVLRMPEGSDLIYSVATVAEADGVHDAVALFVGRGLAEWGERIIALRDPQVCPPHACWGFYESPFVVQVADHYYLFTTHTDSGPETYERTEVYRSADPLHFEGPPITTLQAHGGELHVENGRMFMTRGGWTRYVTEARRGLSIVPIGWVREED